MIPACPERLPEEVVDLSVGDELDPMPARLARAVEVRSRASDANDLLLLLCDILPPWE